MLAMCKCTMCKYGVDAFPVSKFMHLLCYFITNYFQLKFTLINYLFATNSLLEY